MQVLLTGATGFVGQATEQMLRAKGNKVISAVRDSSQQLIPSNLQVSVGEINGSTHWAAALTGCKVVIHLAARAHVINDQVVDSFAVYHRINVEGTLNLARQAAKLGVRRFVFVSSIKVNGEQTLTGHAFMTGDVPRPIDPYGISKHEAEVGLRQIANQTGMEIVIIRPPLVYGPGVKGNFLTLIHMLQRGVPLPFGSVTQNRRSFVALDNLVDLILACVSNPAAANQTFLVSDGEDLSTADLLHHLGAAIGKPARLLPVPPGFLRATAKLFNKGDMAQRLLGNLQVDIVHTCQTLNWKPLVTMHEGLLRVVEGMNK
jgi:nucleoside-diphosphate-sugar epimerase